MRDLVTLVSKCILEMTFKKLVTILESIVEIKKPSRLKEGFLVSSEEQKFKY